MYNTKREPSCKLWSLGDNVGSSVVTDVPLWWGILIMGEAMHVVGTESLGGISVPLRFAVNLNRSLKKECI